MPYTDVELRKKYNRERYLKLRLEYQKILGGKCNKCCSTDSLEIDHKDRVKKTLPTNKFLSVNKILVLKELKKCQLLCNKCHKTKSILESGKKVAKGNHGTTSSYRYCKCELCKEANRNYIRSYRGSVAER